MRQISFILVFLLCVGTGTFAHAQSLVVEPPSKSVTCNAPFDDYSAFSIYYTNTTGYPLDLKWKTLTNTLGTSGTTWDYSICDFGTCYAGIPESATMHTMPPDTTGYLKLNLIPLQGASTALVKIYVYNANTPDVGDTMTFIVNATQAGVSDEQRATSSVRVYPSIASNSIKCTSGDVFIRSISVYSTDGKIALTLSGMNTNDYRMDISTLSAGVYITRVETNGGVVSLHKFEKVN